MEMHKILIGMTLSIILLFGFVFFIAEGVQKYNPSNIPSDYNESFVKITTNMQGLTNIVDQTNNATTIVGTGDINPLADFLGFFFGQAYKAGQVMIGGLSLLNLFADEAIKTTLGDNPLGSITKSVLLTIIAIIIISLLLHFVIKSDRI
jgi:hypothetical protein